MFAATTTSRRTAIFGVAAECEPLIESIQQQLAHNQSTIDQLIKCNDALLDAKYKAKTKPVTNAFNTGLSSLWESIVVNTQQQIDENYATIDKLSRHNHLLTHWLTQVQAMHSPPAIFGSGATQSTSSTQWHVPSVLGFGARVTPTPAVAVPAVTETVSVTPVVPVPPTVTPAPAPAPAAASKTAPATPVPQRSNTQRKSPTSPTSTKLQAAEDTMSYEQFVIQQIMLVGEMEAVYRDFSSEQLARSPRYSNHISNLHKLKKKMYDSIATVKVQGFRKPTASVHHK